MDLDEEQPEAPELLEEAEEGPEPAGLQAELGDSTELPFTLRLRFIWRLDAHSLGFWMPEDSGLRGARRVTFSR